MRYALDARTLTSHFPGIGRYVGNLARALAEQIDERERLLLLWNPREEPHWDGTMPAGRSVEWWEIPVSPFSHRQQWALPKVLRRARADLYHSPYYLMPYWVGLPTVLTLYDSIPEHAPQSASLAARFLFRFATKLALRSASHVLVPSEATRRDLTTSYRFEPLRTTVAPLAAGPHFRPRPEAERKRVREKLSLPEKYVLYLGSSRFHKNLETLLAAWEMVEKHARDAPVLAIAGVGLAPRSSLRLRAPAACPAPIRVVGTVDEADLPALLSGARLFVFPSLHEGFGLPVLEAMACGAPVLCADGSSLTEVTADAALRFDPRDPQELARAILRALADEPLRVDLSRRGLAQAHRFSWRHTASRTLETYRKVLESGERHPQEREPQLDRQP